MPSAQPWTKSTTKTYQTNEQLTICTKKKLDMKSHSPTKSSNQFSKKIITKQQKLNWYSQKPKSIKNRNLLNMKKKERISIMGAVQTVGVGLRWAIEGNPAAGGGGRPHPPPPGSAAAVVSIHTDLINSLRLSLQCVKLI